MDEESNSVPAHLSQGEDWGSVSKVSRAILVLLTVGAPSVMFAAFCVGTPGATGRWLWDILFTLLACVVVGFGIHAENVQTKRSLGCIVGLIGVVLVFLLPDSEMSKNFGYLVLGILYLAACLYRMFRLTASDVQDTLQLSLHIDAALFFVVALIEIAMGASAGQKQEFLSVSLMLLVARLALMWHFERRLAASSGFAFWYLIIPVIFLFILILTVGIAGLAAVVSAWAYIFAWLAGPIFSHLHRLKPKHKFVRPAPVHPPRTVKPTMPTPISHEADLRHGVEFLIVVLLLSLLVYVVMRSRQERLEKGTMGEQPAPVTIHRGWVTSQAKYQMVEPKNEIRHAYQEWLKKLLKADVQVSVAESPREVYERVGDGLQAAAGEDAGYSRDEAARIILQYEEDKYGRP